jgi:hypothetical protein
MVMNFDLMLGSVTLKKMANTLYGTAPGVGPSPSEIAPTSPSQGKPYTPSFSKDTYDYQPEKSWFRRTGTRTGPDGRPITDYAVQDYDYEKLKAQYPDLGKQDFKNFGHRKNQLVDLGLNPNMDQAELTSLLNYYGVGTLEGLQDYYAQQGWDTRVQRKQSPIGQDSYVDSSWTPSEEDRRLAGDVSGWQKFKDVVSFWDDDSPPEYLTDDSGERIFNLNDPWKNQLARHGLNPNMTQGDFANFARRYGFKSLSDYKDFMHGRGLTTARDMRNSSYGQLSYGKQVLTPLQQRSVDLGNKLERLNPIPRSPSSIPKSASIMLLFQRAPQIFRWPS